MAYESTIKFDEPNNDTILLRSLEHTLLRAPLKSSEILLQSGLLGSIATTLQGDNPSSKEKLVSLLADASREDLLGNIFAEYLKLMCHILKVSWRIPFGEVGILRLVLDLLCSDIESEGSRHCLRLVANLCADTDSNRAIVIDRQGLNVLQKILMTNRKLAPVAIVVLFNLCMDYEPAQRMAIQDGVLPLLLELLDKSIGTPGILQASVITYSARVLELLLALDDGRNLCPDSAANTLLTVANSPFVRFEEYVSLIHSSGVLLEDTRFQHFMLSTFAVEIPLAILAQSYTRFPETSDEDNESEEPREVVLHSTRNTLIIAMSDVSALESFLEFYPLESPLVGSLLRWLSIEQADLQVCASIMLGNLARSEAICRALVFEKDVHVPLIKCLEAQSLVGVIHAVGGMLKNLALSCLEVREQIGKGGGIEACDKLYQAGTIAQVHYTGASLTRLLLAGSLNNVARLLSPLSLDPDSPAVNKSHLSLLLDLYSSTADIPTKTEIGRTIASILRIIYSSNTDHSQQVPSPRSNTDHKDLEFRLFSIHREIARPLVDMVMQNKWPAVRSEGWFALALMARNKAGAESASNETIEPKFYEAIFIAMGRKDEWDAALGHLNDEEKEADDNSQTYSNASNRKANIQDRDNVLIFMSEILKNWGDNMAWMRKNILQNLMEGKSLADILGDEGGQSLRALGDDSASEQS